MTVITVNIIFRAHRSWFLDMTVLYRLSQLAICNGHSWLGFSNTLHAPMFGPRLLCIIAIKFSHQVFFSSVFRQTMDPSQLPNRHQWVGGCLCHASRSNHPRPFMTILFRRSQRFYPPNANGPTRLHCISTYRSQIFNNIVSMAAWLLSNPHVMRRPPPRQTTSWSSTTSLGQPCPSCG